MSRAVLLDAGPSRRPAVTDAVITLSAVAEYACRRDGLTHRDLSAIASEHDLAALQDEYWDAQVEWLQLLDRRLTELSPTLAASGMRPIAACGYTLKLLLDGLFIKGFESAALTAGDWSELVHYARAGGPRLLGEVLPLFCDSRGVSYSRETERWTSGEARSGPLSRIRQAVVPGLRAALQVARAQPRRVRPQSGALRLLLLTGHYDSADLLRRNATLGGRSLLVARRHVLDLRRGLPRAAGQVPVADAADRRAWRDVAQSVADDAQLAAWPLSWFGGELAPLVADRLAAWVADTLPDVMAAATWFDALYEEEDVEAVIAPFLAGSVEIGAFTAARASRSTRAVLVEHGDIAHAAPSWDLNLLAADVVVVPSQELAEYLVERRGSYPEPTGEVVVGSYRWQRYARLAERATGQRSRRPEVDLGEFDESRPTLVYLVTALASDSRYLNNAWYPDAWYFGLQAAIVDALERHDRFNVVVKLFPATEHDVSPIAEYVASRAPHVMVSREPFSAWIPFADRIIADMASTGLYESLFAGRPAMGLLWRNHAVRPGASAVLGDALQLFTTHEEAAALTDQFATVLVPRAPHLRPDGPDMLTSLRRLCSAGPPSRG